MRGTPIEPTTTNTTECFHCGLPAAPGTRFRAIIDGQSQPMCCAGCEAVAQAIVTAGLGDYYRHRSALPGAAREVLPDFLKNLDLYDNPDIQASFVRQAGEQVREAALILEGIRCAACVWLNERHIGKLQGVLSVDINHTTQRARVCWDDSRIKLSDILRAVSAIGYTAHPFDPSRQEEIHRKQRRTALWQLFVAGFGMMQVMMYTVPMYLAGAGDMPRDIEQLMRIASLILTLPVVLYSAAPFFRNAWFDLRRRRLGMDVPVALGVGGAFLASCWATWQGAGEIYFDSIAMFVFLLLTGRYLEMIARAKASDAIEKLVKLIPATALLLPDYPEARTDRLVAVSALKAGDYLMVPPGQSIPADGRVEQGESTSDEALLSGESRPIAKRPGDRLTGGAINMDSPLIMQVERAGQDTVLAGIIRLMDRALAEKPRIALLADRAASWFVLVLLVIAGLTYAAWYPDSPAKAFWVTVSVLVVTCPCALSLATPAALVAATGRLAAMGLLITRGHALETLGRATDFIFDKTGTLTYGRMTLQQVTSLGELSAARCHHIAAALEHGSEHPIAKALRAAPGFPARPANSATVAGNLRNVPGSGVEGTIDGLRFRLGTPSFVAELVGTPPPSEATNNEGMTTIVLGRQGQWLAAFSLGDQLRPDAHALVAQLRHLGKEVHLLTGDAWQAAQPVAEKIGIDHVSAAASPADKLAYVRALQQQGKVVAMLGDGINDAPVLGQAQISIAMAGLDTGTEVAQASADMVLLSGQLEDLATALHIARKTVMVIRQNLAWAVVYNLAALPLAMLGLVTPWMAGIGMSASSLLVVLNALRLRGRATGGHRASPVPSENKLAFNPE